MDSFEIVRMTVDEFETIRLIDLEGVTQEQCAVQMNVARTTAQAIYNSARIKIAECLIHEKELHIEGGEYELCDGNAKRCRCKCPNKELSAKESDKKESDSDQWKEKREMKVAVTYEDGQVFQHFGHTEQFKIYGIDGGKVASAVIVDTNGSGHGALADFLRQEGVDTLICGGIGGGAKQALSEAGIQLFGGVSGGADEAVAMLLSGNLAYDPQVMCSHHGEDHRDTCEGHDCGEHHCGE